MSEYIIEDNIPIPPKQHGHRRPRSESMVPWLRKLQVGQSFWADVGQARIASAASYVPDAKFVTRVVGSGARVWRVA